MARVRDLTLLMALCSLILAVPAFGARKARKAAEFRQGDLAYLLIKKLKMGAGVPKSPTVSDYLAVFDGRRTFRFEAEDSYDPRRDYVSVQTNVVSGPFTGTGWLEGIATATTVHFSVFLPLPGEYTLTAVAKGKGEQWTVGDKTFTANPGRRFGAVTVGKVTLAAGKHEVTLLLPPEGGIDAFVLAAPRFRAISPLGGWQFGEPLLRKDLAVIVAELKGLDERLGPDPAAQPLVAAASSLAKLPPGVTKSTAGYLGKFTPPAWVRAGMTEETLTIPLDVPADALYDVRIRYMGKTLKAELAGETFEKGAKPYLDWVDLGVIRLPQGATEVRLELPLGSGVDVVECRKLRSSPEDYLALTGLGGKPDAPVSRTEAIRILDGIAADFAGRR